MKNFFPPKSQSFSFLQTNRSNVAGSIWSSMNLDFQSNLGVIRLSQKLVQNTSSADDADLGVPVAFEFWNQKWFAICDTTIFANASADVTQPFTEDTGGYIVGDSTSQFDVTNPAGTTFTYTWDGTGLDPGITALTFPVGSVVTIAGTNLAAGNRGTFTITGSGANFFSVTNASGVVESNKTIGTGSIRIAGGSTSKTYSYQESDLAVFDDRLWSTSSGLNAHLYSRTASTWTVRDDLGANAMHKLLYFKKFDRLYYSNDVDTISSIDSSNAVADPGADYAITLGKSIGEFVTMVASSQFVWIATTRSTNSSLSNGTQGSISAWDGFSAQVTNEYILPTGGVLGMTVLNDVPYGMDSEGRLLKYTGYSFEEIARLPIDVVLLTGSTVTHAGVSAGRFIHYNGMQATKNNTIIVNVRNLNFDAQSNITENFPSGIWECDLATGNFTHRYSFTLKTLASATVSDYGQNRIATPGAIKLNTFDTATGNGRSSLLAGAAVFTDLTTKKYAIYVDSPTSPTTDVEGQKRGYHVTTWFASDEIQDKWTRLWATFRRFLNSTDKMVFKYRTTEELAVLADITWVSTTQFTTTTDVSAYAPGTPEAPLPPFNGTVGGEVEVIQATGSGACVHITSVVNNAGTYTVTLEEAVPNVTGTGRARFQKWIKIFPEITGQSLSYGQLPIDKSDTRIQVKCVMEWTGDDEFHKMAIFSNEDIKINA